MSIGDNIKIDWGRPPLIVLRIVIMLIALRILFYLIKLVAKGGV